MAAVNAEIDAQLPPVEAVPIALHLVNASFHIGYLAQTHQMTGVFSQIFDVIDSSFDRAVDRESIDVARLAKAD